MYSVESLKGTIPDLVRQYNANAPKEDRIERVALFGSYAENRATETSDVDLLVTFASTVVSLFTLAKVLESMEHGLGVSVDIVQEPMPQDSLLVIKETIPLYEGD